ncbi:MAG: ribbon-helix-helix domain-containing protein, partial [Pyrobaculum sp.]
MGRVAQYRHIISLHISDRQRETLRCLSRRLQMPMSELIRRAIDEFIEKYKDCEGET